MIFELCCFLRLFDEFRLIALLFDVTHPNAVHSLAHLYAHSHFIYFISTPFSRPLLASSLFIPTSAWSVFIPSLSTSLHFYIIRVHFRPTATRLCLSFHSIPCLASHPPLRLRSSSRPGAGDEESPERLAYGARADRGWAAGAFLRFYLFCFFRIAAVRRICYSPFSASYPLYYSSLLAFPSRSCTSPAARCWRAPRAFVNTAKIKGTPNTMRTGMLAAEARFESTSLPAAVAPRRWDAPSTSEPETPAPSETPAEAEGAEWYPPPAHLAARVQRNVPTLAHVCGSVGCPPLVQRPGVLGGVLYSGVDILLRGRVPWTFRRHKKGEIFCLLPSPAPTPAGL
ncbi:hypothetical protein C8J57DRAFT_1526047 [Mycena rebaudengoi]|nr:hypothetical protein C8J57DRAFT_1526047 [Mycena rebaudengoi]